MSLDPIQQRQLELGAASFFRPEAETPPGNQIVVKAGFAFRGAFGVEDQFTTGDQTTAGFASVTLAGNKRYDLVYIDASGAVQILQGNEVAAASPAYDGAPGFNLGPDMPDQAVPVAYVEVTETGAVTVDAADITQITGFVSISRELDGFQVDKGLFGAAPTGNSDDVSALFASDISGGSSSQRGVITAPPLNFVTIVDQDGDELIRTADGSQVYGRITEAAGTWTLTYFANVAGVETAVDVDTDITTSPTDLRLIGVPQVYSRNDPTRPLFYSNVARLSDLAAADIPVATNAIQGKVRIESDGSSTGADLALGTSDARTGAVQGRANAGAVSGYQPVVRLIQGANITIALVEAGGELQFTISAAGGGGPSFSVNNGDLQQDGAANVGNTGTVVHSNHVHPTSSAYRPASYNVTGQSNQVSAAVNVSLTPTGGFTPRLALMTSVQTPAPGESGIGMGTGTAGSAQSFYGSTAGGQSYDAGFMARYPINAATSNWQLSTFNTGSVAVNRTAGAGTLNAHLIALGDG